VSCIFADIHCQYRLPGIDRQEDLPVLCGSLSALARCSYPVKGVLVASSHNTFRHPRLPEQPEIAASR
jgi:hypothetical protein